MMSIEFRIMIALARAAAFWDPKVRLRLRLGQILFLLKQTTGFQVQSRFGAGYRRGRDLGLRDSWFRIWCFGYRVWVWTSFNPTA